MTGTVLDPGGLPVAGAHVSVHCPMSEATAATDAHGAFVVSVEQIEPGCVLQVSAAGFANVERRLEDRARPTIVIRLNLRPHEEHLMVRGELPAFESPRLATADGAVLREFVSDVDEMLDYARALAGSSNDRGPVMVDGVRRATLPAAARIDRISVNRSAYSAAHAGLDGGLIEIETAPLRRLWSFGGNVSPGAIMGRHPLGAGRQMQTRTASAAATGPLAGAGFAWAAGVSHTRREQEQPLLSPPPRVATQETVLNGDRSTQAFGTAAYASSATHATVDVALDDSRTIAVGAGGLVAPEAATDGRARTVETHASVRTIVRSIALKASATAGGRTRDARARSTDRGLFVSGGAVAGGAVATSERSRTVWSSWVVRAEGRALDKDWRAGIDLNSSRASETWTPNRFGAVYMAPVAAGGSTLVALEVDSGDGRAESLTRTAAVFGEMQWVRTPVATLSSGLRIDVARGDTAAFQPRVSATIRVAGGQLALGAGRFVEDWTAETLLPLQVRSAPGIEHYAADAACNGQIGFAAPTSGLGPDCLLRGTVETDVSRQRRTVASIGMSRPLRRIDLSGEYRWSATARVPSLERIIAPQGWIERFGSAGRQQQHELRTRMASGPPARSLIAHYTWRHARETTDGWYGSPFSRASLDLWVPAANVPRHEAGLVFSVRTRRGTSVSAVASATSGRPLDLVLAPRTLAELLSEPRRPGPRNAGNGPRYATVSLYASQRLRLPFARTGGRLGVQLHNVLNRRNLLAPIAVVDSPLYGRATAAATGRTLSVWFSFDRSRSYLMNSISR